MLAQPPREDLSEELTYNFVPSIKLFVQRGGLLLIRKGEPNHKFLQT